MKDRGVLVLSYGPPLQKLRKNKSALLKNQMTKRFLIVHLACFGDCLFATAIASQIKHDYPDSHITWAIASKYKSILELNPHIDAVWEVPISDGDYYNVGWGEIEREALLRKTNGEFDEVIFSQIDPLNLKNYNGTIRGTILSTYKKPITVSVAPVMRLSRAEIERVRKFAANKQLHNYTNVVLFECAPGSGQSQVDADFALTVARKVTETMKDVCFIISTNKKTDFASERIIDASELTFRENAELTRYCTLFVGCSSGITWLATSDWAKKLPMLQLLSDKSAVFAGIHYDFELNGLDNSHIIEMIDYDAEKVVACLRAMICQSVEKAKVDFHQTYKPNKDNFYALVKALTVHNANISTIFKFTTMYVKHNKELNNPVQLTYADFITRLLHLKLRFSQNVFLKISRKIIRHIRKQQGVSQIVHLH